MGRICFFPNCVPKSHDFVVFPFRRTSEFESWWIKSGWSNLLSTKKLPDKILICEGHFDESLINRRSKVPRLAVGSLPTRNIECPAKKIAPKPEPSSNEVLLHRLFCRLCGEMQETNLDEDAPLLENLDDILRHLQLSESVLLPMGVCSGCKEKAEFVLRFWQECNDAQDNLRVIFNQGNTIELLATEVPGNDYQQVPHDDVCHTEDTGPETANVEHDYDSRSDIFDVVPKEEVYSHESETIVIQSPPPDPPKPAQTVSNETEKVVEQKTQADTSLICEICGKLLRSRAALNIHFKSHSSERAHTCNTCGKKFRQRRALIEHSQSKHENRLFPCRVCGEIYRWQKGLDRHMKLHKGNIAKHPCSVCEKTFPHPHQLKRHMMLHSGDRIYCDVCGKGYRFNYMLTQHKIREHNMHFEGVKLYTKPHMRNKTMRKRIKKEPEPPEQLKSDYVDEEASEIVEYDSIAIDINPVDGSEISRETYIVEQIDDNHHLEA